MSATSSTIRMHRGKIEVRSANGKVIRRYKQRKPTTADRSRWARQENRAAFRPRYALRIWWKPGAPGDDVDVAFQKICRKHCGKHVGAGTSLVSGIRDSDFVFKKREHILAACQAMDSFIKKVPRGFRFSSEVAVHEPYKQRKS